MTTDTAQSFSHLEKLVNHSQPGSISIVMPTHESGRQVQQNAIRFKNLVSQATEQLVHGGQSQSAVERRLKRLSELQRDDAFWQHRTSGLVLYFSDGEPTTIDLYQSPEEFVFVAEQYFLPPSVLEAVSQQHQSVLALTWDEATLYHANQTSLEAVDNQHFPVALRDVVLPPDPEEQLQFRTQGTSSGRTMYHGQGKGEGMIESDRHRFLSEIGKRIQNANDGQRLPLVVVGTDEVLGEFAKATKVDADHTITLSPDSLSEAKFQQRILAELEREQRDTTRGEAHIRKLELALSRDLGSRDTGEIAEAANTGRVECLLIEQRVGYASDQLETVELTQINAALIGTLQNGGRVVKCSDGSLGPAPLAAIYRY